VDNKFFTKTEKKFNLHEKRFVGPLKRGARDRCLARFPLKPFNAHQSQYIGPRFFGYNSPAAAAREVFKPSTDAGRLLGSIFKKIF